MRQLWWELTKHILHRRGRDEVFVSIDWELPFPSAMATGAVVAFSWETHPEDAFCTIDAIAEDPVMYHDPAEAIPDLERQAREIEAL